MGLSRALATSEQGLGGLDRHSCIAAIGVGADAYCRDAAVAVETAKSLLARRQGSAQAHALAGG